VQTKLDKLNEESLKLKEGALVFSGKYEVNITNAIKRSVLTELKEFPHSGKENIISP